MYTQAVFSIVIAVHSGIHIQFDIVIRFVFLTTVSPTIG